MLLKPIFEKAPLKRAVMLPLRPGQMLTDDSVCKTLAEMAERRGLKDRPMLWEGALRVGALVNPHPEKLPVADLIRETLADQAEDGSLALPLTDSLAVMRAAWALYEASCSRQLVEAMLRWCGHLSSIWEEVTGCAAIRRSPADLLDLLEQLYRVTGKKALLSLADRLRQAAMNWAGVLHTFSVQQPLNKITSVKDMQRGMTEEDSEEGFYTRQALTCHGLSLADGARASVLCAAYSGSGQELSAARIGWEKISRFHGAMNGGICCDEMLAGNSPDAPVDTAALGAWVEALCTAMEQDADATLWDALSIMGANALPRAVMNGELQLSQKVNALKAESGKASIRLDENTDRYDMALARLMRGAAALCSHAVTMTADSVSINLPVSGRCVCAVDGKPVTLLMKSAENGMTIEVHAKDPVNMKLKLRMPGFVTDGFVKVSRGGSAKMEAGTQREATRAWQDGDTVTMSWKPEVRLVQGFHQGLCAYLGSNLMTLNDQTGWALAANGEVTVDEAGQVLLSAAPVEWKSVKGEPASLPVLPVTAGEIRQVKLTPYAQCLGVSLFPKQGNC